MLNQGTIKQDATVRFMFSTAAADGGEENFSATLEEADVVVRKDGSNMTLDASTITINNVATGVYEIAIDTSNDADFTGDSEYWVFVDPDAETIDSQAVSGIIGVFRIESDSEQAVRLLQEHVYPDSVIATVTSNSTTAIDLTDIVDAQTPDAALEGLILAVHDATDDRVEHVVVTSASSLVATVQRLGDGTAMSFTVAAGDHVWIVGHSDLGQDGSNLTEAGGTGDQLTALNDLSAAEVNAEVDSALADYDPPTRAELTSDINSLNDPTATAIRDAILNRVLSGNHDTAGTIGALAQLLSSGDIGGIDVSELNSVVDDLLDAGRLDALFDAIKAKTDSLTFTQAGEVDANVQSINNAGVTGDGTSGTEWGSSA